MTRPGIDGYVDDSLYPSSFHAMFSPVWTDRLIVRHGRPPPRTRPRAPFTMIDIGCGDGFGLIVNAAAYPEGRFIGIDAMPGHIARGQALAAEIGLTNIDFHCQTFSGAAGLDLPPCDYAMAQGVLSWVTPANQQALLALASSALRPGGVLTIGYNCWPGWIPIAPLQRLLRVLADGRRGTPRQRFAAAMRAIRKGALLDTVLLDEFDSMIKNLPPDYFAHEYLNRHWEPMWSGDAIETIEAHGLKFAGIAMVDRLREDFAFRAVERTRLAGAKTVRAREIVADVIQKRWFRIDQFVKSPAGAIRDGAMRRAWLEGWWTASLAPADVEWETTTPAGTLRFDNAAARAIMARLENGPARLSDVSGVSEADLLNTADALMVAQLIRPAEPPVDCPMASALHEKIQSVPGMNGLAGRCGAVAVPRGSIRRLSPETLRRVGVTVPI